MTITEPLLTGLPDPEREPAFYEGVLLKRALSWVADVALITVVTLVLIPFTAFTALFYLPLLFVAVGFLYRWGALARFSGTLGMLLTGIELRRWDGMRFDPVTAFLHVAGYTTAVALFPLQLVSITLMAVTSRRQGLIDHILGTAAIRRAAA